MAHALTIKGQITIPKAMRDHMGVSQGQEIDFVAQPGGQVLMFPAKKTQEPQNPFLKWRGTGILKKSTQEILRATRGDDCMQ